MTVNQVTVLNKMRKYLIHLIHFHFPSMQRPLKRPLKKNTSETRSSHYAHQLIFPRLLPSLCLHLPLLLFLALLQGFSKVMKTLSAESSREELLAFLRQYGSHYVSEALYGSELSCNIYFPSKKTQQQLWLQYQKGKAGAAPPREGVVRRTGLPREGIGY